MPRSSTGSPAMRAAAARRALGGAMCTNEIVGERDDVGADEGGVGAVGRQAAPRAIEQRHRALDGDAATLLGEARGQEL